MATLTNDYQYLGASSAMKSQNNNRSYYLLLYGKTYADPITGIHTVTIKSVLASSISEGTFYLYGTTFNGTINGSTVFSGKNKPDSKWELGGFSAGNVNYKEGTVIGEGSIEVDCTDGLSKDITLSSYWKFTVSGAAYTPAKNTERTVVVTVTLPAIPRAAEIITAPSFDDINYPLITYSNPAGESVTSLQVGIFDSTGNIAYVPYQDISKKTGTHYALYISSSEIKALMSACGDSNSVPIVFYLKTTIGSNTYLSKPVERTFSIVDANPIITADVVCDDDTYELTNDRHKLIKYFSNATATMSAEAQKGGVINETRYVIKNGDNEGNGTTHTFEKVENNVFTFSAEDNRGNVGTAIITEPDITMIEYIKPACVISNNRPDGLGNMTVSCTGVFFNGSFGAVENTLKVQYRYKVYDGTFCDWVDMSVTEDGYGYYASADFVIPDFNQNLFYSFETRAIDKLMTVPSLVSTVKSIPIFHWGEEDFVFEVPVTFKKGMIDETKTDEQTNVGYWSPSLNLDIAPSYTIQYGWYKKEGQVVSIGFFIKANCISDGHATPIKISGLPFAPILPAAGGGMCSGAYIYDGFTFQCFVAETNGDISTRVQNIGYTSPSNIDALENCLFYPSGSGELVLSGTIIYLSDS